MFKADACHYRQDERVGADPGFDVFSNDFKDLWLYRNHNHIDMIGGRINGHVAIFSNREGEGAGFGIYKCNVQFALLVLPACG